MFSACVIEQWNPTKATFVPNWRGGTFSTGPDRKTVSKLLPECNLVQEKLSQGARTQYGEMCRNLGVVVDLPGWMEFLPQDNPPRRFGADTTLTESFLSFQNTKNSKNTN
jgi:hypothetical protein